MNDSEWQGYYNTTLQYSSKSPTKRASSFVEIEILFSHEIQRSLHHHLCQQLLVCLLGCSIDHYYPNQLPKRAVSNHQDQSRSFLSFSFQINHEGNLVIAFQQKKSNLVLEWIIIISPRCCFQKPHGLCQEHEPTEILLSFTIFCCTVIIIINLHHHSAYDPSSPTSI